MTCKGNTRNYTDLFVVVVFQKRIVPKGLATEPQRL